MWHACLFVELWFTCLFIKYLIVGITGCYTVYVDRSSNFKGSGVGVIVENSEGIVDEIFLGLSFLVTNNTAEYEAFLAGLRIVKDLGARKIRIFTDSQLVA